MSEIEISTVPNTPPSFGEDVLASTDHGVCAWLQPINQLTDSAFDAALNMVIKDWVNRGHVRQFFQANSRVCRARSAFSEDESGDDGDGLLQRGVSKEWSGSFKLSLDILSRKPAEGWYLGSAPQRVDLVLSPPAKKHRDWGIAGKHARIFFHADSGRILIEARHTLTIGAAGGPDAITNSICRVLEDGSLLTIGDCVYVFQHTPFFREPAFQNHLHRFMCTHRSKGQWTLHQRLVSASTGETMLLGKYVRKRWTKMTVQSLSDHEPS